MHCHTHPAAVNGAARAPVVRVGLARCPHEFRAVAGVWAESLLIPGLTEWEPPSSPEGAAALAEEVAARLAASAARKRQAASESRELRRRGAALVQRLRGAGGLSAVEWHNTRRQLEGVRKELRRARRRRMWACLLAYTPHAGPAQAPGPNTGPDTLAAAAQGEPSSTCGLENPSSRGPGPHTELAAGGQGHSSGSTNSSGSGPHGPGNGDGQGHSSGGWRLAGYALVSLAQPLALLPPPLPSRSPQQVHVDGLAVAPDCRRSGVASALLDAAERLARRWGGASLWLHVEAANAPAVQLYTDRGYGVARVNAASYGLPHGLQLGGGGGGGGGGGTDNALARWAQHLLQHKVAAAAGGSAGGGAAAAKGAAGGIAAAAGRVHASSEPEKHQRRRRRRGREYVMTKTLATSATAQEAVATGAGSSAAAAKADSAQPSGDGSRSRGTGGAAGAYDWGRRL
ncbi:hypothetical protein HYH03_005225 [Edaphochlamys debaryana]|uniref:N-acetyltransferase domain-containing protein n=1 Tax=Edaphochlamys debaryana TaxID=47281 RepID=A0A835YFU1_9CHLO|nr:hypothetical protein HYH03_005225 [Edaphochlamys debaryana]|eukprot:KAG2496819.1 hypothetical protein HYH03_005225 [Edaphochlamys debaryana]